MNSEPPSPPFPNCNQCRHFFITYEPKHPYGCRAMGFKAPKIPAEVVLINSGMPCLRFAAKLPKKEG